MGRVFKEYQITPGKCLDIGCGHAMFLRAAKSSGWDAVGLDYPSKATKYARNVLGLNVIEDELVTALTSGKLPEAQFDFITAWHCIEHCATPIEHLRCMAKLLKPGGKALVAVPNAESYGMKTKREDWVWCQEPYVHVVHFTSASLARAATEAGLKVAAVWSRDTWDANPTFDARADQTTREIANRLDRIHWRLGGLGFWFEESLRLLFYAVGCFDHWFLGKECRDLDGSELLLLAERPRE